MGRGLVWATDRRSGCCARGQARAPVLQVHCCIAPRLPEGLREYDATAAWDHWLATYPDTPRVPEAKRCRQEAAEFELASSIDTKVMWRAFLKAWPDGRHELDAELRLRRGE